VLHLTDEEFWSITPKQFHLLLDKHEQQVEHQELLFGQLTSTVINWGFCRPEQPAKPRDYMPSQWAQLYNVRKPRLSRKVKEKVSKQIESCLWTLYKTQQAKLGKPVINK